MSTAALFLLCTTSCRYLTLGTRLKALAIAASSPEYGFYSTLVPSVEVNV